MKPFADHFSRVASEYSSCRPTYPAELFVYLSDLVSRHELAWDCAAGSGQATNGLTRRFRRVLATDASGAMLAQAPRHKNTEYRVSPAEVSGLEDSSADLVTVAQALHWLDLGPFYAEVDRVLRPGGVLAAWCYAGLRIDDPVLDRTFQRFSTEVVGPYWPEGRRHVEAGYRSLAFPYQELPPPSLSMQERWTPAQLIGYASTWSATLRFRELRGYDPVVQLAAELAAGWGDPASDRLVCWPMSMRVGRKLS
jgi:ubiquinone/menaquinone biosynthesis C-methylase UbiE